MKKSIELIRHNKVRHDSVVSEYDKMHVEIFNTTEQARIGHVVKWAVSEIRTGALAPTGDLGFWCRNRKSDDASLASGSGGLGC